MVVPWTREAIKGIVDEAAKQGELVYAFNQGKSASRFKAWLNQFLMKSGYAAPYTSGSVLRLVG